MEKNSYLIVSLMLSLFLFSIGCGEPGEMTDVVSAISQFGNGDDVALPYDAPGDDTYDFDEADDTDYDYDNDKPDEETNERIVPYSRTKEKSYTESKPMLICPYKNLPDGTVGEPFSYELEASGREGPIYFEIKYGTLPEGLTLSEDGLVSGTPTQPAKSYLSITISSDDNSSRVCSLKLSIKGDVDIAEPTNDAEPSETPEDDEELENDNDDQIALPNDSPIENAFPIKPVALIVTLYQNRDYEGRHATYVDSVEDVSIKWDISVVDMRVPATSSIKIEKGPNYDSDSKVRFCGPSYKGCSKWMGPGKHASMSSIDDIGNDSIFSIEFNDSHKKPSSNYWNEAGIQVIARLYQHANCSGESVDIIESTPHLKLLDFNDRTSSVRVFKGPECGAKYCEVTFFQHGNYEGHEGTLIEDGYDGRCFNTGDDFYDRDDSISSVLIESFDAPPESIGDLPSNPAI
ncbi:MAG: hypothetical protein HN337_05185 [Deltaproteobacteria bacterium]|jgi:hypothetical protein|nr:hypothetical protein [Deltaproteobacteria bacterium]